MAIYQCKMCGGKIQASDNAYGTCDSCGSTMTLPKASDDQKVNLFNRANNLRRQNEFDKAVTAYENILNLEASSSEAHWGLVLSKYGIEYVEDPATGQRVPTCHRVQSDSVLTDADYLSALDNAEDEYTRSLYEEEAKKISEIQKGILAISAKEEPYDVFICYKETTDGGSRTKDSALGQDLYYQLEKEGYKVFFSRISLESKLGQQYEPYIFNALNSARVMLVVGTKPEYFNAIWVKNEWSRFLALMKKDRSKLLIPCYRDMDAYDLPEEMAMLQSQDMGRIGFAQDIMHGIKKVVDSAKTNAAQGSPAAGTTTAAPGVESLMKRGWLFLEDGNWKQANEYFDKVLDIDPEHAPAYIGKLCTELKIKNETDLGNYIEPFDEMPNYKKALRFAVANYRVILDKYNLTIKERIAEQKRQEQERIAEEKRRRAEEERQRVEETQRRIEYFTSIREHTTKYQRCIAASGCHVVALRRDGTVVAVGDNGDRQCSIRSWRNIIAVAAGYSHTIGLKVNGLVIANGNNRSNECDTNDWRGIIAIAAGSNHTVGLKSDGTVVTVGSTTSGQCSTSGWRDIVAVTAGGHHTVGLKEDGTVIAVGSTTNGKCATNYWRNIVAVAAGDGHTVGLKADGTVVAVGTNSDNQCNTSSWQDIVAITAGSSHTVGIKADGTVIAVGRNNDGQCNTASWRDIVAVTAGRCHVYFDLTVGLKEDGTLVTVGSNYFKQHDANQWGDIGPVNEMQLLQQYNYWAQQGLCIHCGGQIGGMFTKKCKSCGTVY